MLWRLARRWVEFRPGFDSNTSTFLCSRASFPWRTTQSVTEHEWTGHSGLCFFLPPSFPSWCGFDEGKLACYRRGHASRHGATSNLFSETGGFMDSSRGAKVFLPHCSCWKVSLSLFLSLSPIYFIRKMLCTCRTERVSLLLVLLHFHWGRPPFYSLFVSLLSLQVFLFFLSCSGPMSCQNNRVWINPLTISEAR